MIIRKSIIIIVLVLVSLLNQVRAAVPGYMGRRAMVQYSFGATPVMFTYKYLSDKLTNGSNSIIPAFTYSHTLNLEYAAGRRTNIGFNYVRGNVNVVHHFKIPYPVKDDWGEIDTLPLPVRFKKNLFAYNEFGIKFKFFTKGMLAPVGKYTLFTFSRMNIKLKENAAEATGTFDNNGSILALTKKFNRDSISVVGYRFGMGIGQTKMLTSKVGFTLEVLLCFNRLDIDKDFLQNKDDLMSVIKKDFGRDQRYQLKMGISYHF